MHTHLKNDVLDAGCGTGNITHYISSNRNYTITSIDSSESMLKIAKLKLANQDNVEILYVNLNENFPINSDTYNYVILSNVLYSLNNPQTTLKEIYRVLKNDGKLIIVDPIKNPDIIKILADHLKISKDSFFKKCITTSDLIFVGLINFLILKRGKNNKVYHFYDDDQFKDILYSCNFSIESKKRVYSEQSTMFIARKTT